jgi:uncharacterized protein (TIGR02118 family)
LRSLPDKVIAVVRDPNRPSTVAPAVAGLVRRTLYLPTAGEPVGDPTVRAVWMLWVHDARAAAFAWASAAYLVDERPQWGVGERGGITRLSFLLSAPGVTRPQFAAHWSDVHSALARRHHPGLWRYVQNVVIDGLTPDTPALDGIAELSFRSIGDLRDRLYDSDEGRRVIGADVRRFIDVAAGWRVLTAEHAVAAPNSNAF